MAGSKPDLMPRFNVFGRLPTVGISPASTHRLGRNEVGLQQPIERDWQSVRYPGKSLPDRKRVSRTRSICQLTGSA